MPAEGVPLSPNDSLLTTGEIIRLSRIFVEEGVDKIRLTGGEPTLRKDIDDLIFELGRIEGLKTLAMTTNGLVLHRKIEKLREGGLNLVNISLDTLISDKYEVLTRRKGWNHVMRSIEKALSCGFDPVKVNCVVMKGVNDDELLDFVAWTKESNVEIRFIEYMPFDGNMWNDDKFLSYRDMLKIIRSRFPLERVADLPNNTSKTYGVEGWKGKVGFITSMSENFCSSCNRVRLMADGALKVCLFGSSEISLRDMMRDGASDEELRQSISMAVKRKKASHDGMHELDKNKEGNRPMILIGG